MPVYDDIYQNLDIAMSQICCRYLCLNYEAFKHVEKAMLHKLNK